MIHVSDMSLVRRRTQNTLNFMGMVQKLVYTFQIDGILFDILRQERTKIRQKPAVNWEIRYIPGQSGSIKCSESLKSVNLFRPVIEPSRKVRSYFWTGPKFRLRTAVTGIRSL
jgi:hypothetical protein